MSPRGTDELLDALGPDHEFDQAEIQHRMRMAELAARPIRTSLTAPTTAAVRRRS